ncbi:hypothetical protein [Streptomyces sp. NPDC057301]
MRIDHLAQLLEAKGVCVNVVRLMPALGDSLAQQAFTRAMFVPG